MKPYFRLCVSSVESVLALDLGMPLHYWFGNEGDFASRIYQEIAQKTET
jgi:hypothetical protein